MGLINVTGLINHPKFCRYVSTEHIFNCKLWRNIVWRRSGLLRLTKGIIIVRETASTQIKNAQEVRIEISGYYFSVFANQSQATREVNCFVDAVI